MPDLGALFQGKVSMKTNPDWKLPESNHLCNCCSNVNNDHWYISDKRKGADSSDKISDIWITGHVRNSLLQRLLFLFETGHYYMVIFILQLNTSLQTKNCTSWSGSLPLTVGHGRSQMLTQSDMHTHTRARTQGALLSLWTDSTSEQVDPTAFSHNTHAPRWEQETTYWFSLPPGRTGSSTVDPWRLLPSPWCCPLFVPLSSPSS